MTLGTGVVCQFVLLNRDNLSRLENDGSGRKEKND